MSIVKSWAGDGLSTGTLGTSTAGTGDDAFDSVAGASLSVASEGIRTPCVGVPDGTGTATATWALGSAPTNWAFRFYVKRGPSLPLLAQVDDGTNKAAGFDFNGSGNLRLSTKAGGTNVNSWIATSVFPTDTWMRVEYTETSAGAWTAAYFTGDGTTAVESSSGTKTAQAAAKVTVGRISGAVASSGLFLDDVALSDTATAIGPVSSGARTPIWHRFDGSSWVPSQMHRVP